MWYPGSNASLPHHPEGKMQDFQLFTFHDVKQSQTTLKRNLAAGTMLNFVPGDPNLLLAWAPGTHTVHRHAGGQKTHTHKKTKGRIT